MLYVNSISLLFYSPNHILRFSKEASRSKVLKKKKTGGGSKIIIFFKKKTKVVIFAF